MLDYTDEQVKVLNAHRGAELAQQATGCCDATREKIAALLEADSRSTAVDQRAVDLLRDCEEFVRHAAQKAAPNGRAPEVYARLIAFLRPHKDT